ncbi:MAG: hypothetical protein ACQEXJ_06630 [Myxococcota bacterium]
MSYERRGYSDNLSDGDDFLRNYHHFLFLSRKDKSDPWFFSAEVVDLTFYEFGGKFGPDGGPWNFTFKAGKLMVPFGADPLFHNAYGGLSGFDQEILPIIWSQFGLTTNFTYRVGPVRLRADTYVVQGHELGEEDDVLDLKSDFSSGTDVKPAFGSRLSAGWGPIALYYSLYVNPLGFDRNLVMQAVDLTIWRLRDIPVVEDLALTLGFMRADVTGGDAPDYYHFGDYLELRYYPLDWLWFQYRTGLRTHDNRKGAFYDDRREDQLDQSAHSLSVTATFHGFSLSAQHVWQLEKFDEQDDDFLRITATYEF